MKQLQDKVAIVTGAGRGFGRAISTAFAREGAKVVVASRTPGTVEKAVEEIKKEGGTAIGVVVDVGERDQVFDMARKAAEAFGTVDILVNNAQSFGTDESPKPSTTPVPFEDTDDAEMDRTFRTGAMATLWGMQAVFPYMKGRGGKIINIGSSAGQMGMEGITPYNVTKEAVRVMSRTAAREWGVHKINVNVINPTLYTESFAEWEAARPEFVEAFRQSSPLKRLGDPLKDGAPVAVFLASSASDYVTGMTIMTDGGIYIHP